MNFREQITVFRQAELSDQANRQHLIDTAKARLSEVQASGQATQHYTTAIDGHIGDIEQATKQIVFTFSFISDVVLFALSYLKTRVQKASCTTANSFWVSVNGGFTMADAFDPTSVPFDAEIVIGNLVPQWRRIDVNLVGSRTLHFQYPGDLDDCVRAVKRQYGTIVSAKRASDYAFNDKYVPKHTDYRFQSPVLILSPST